MNIKITNNEMYTANNAHTLPTTYHLLNHAHTTHTTHTTNMNILSPPSSGNASRYL